jgi:hypothetical protein
MTTTDSTPDLLAAVNELGLTPSSYGRVLDTARAPAALEVIGEALAASLQDYRLDVLLVWDASDNAVLAHAVARRLRIGVARASEHEGLLFFDPPLPTAGAAAVVATAWDKERWLSSLMEFTRSQGSRVAVVGAVLATTVIDAVTDVPTATLIEDWEQS